MYWLAFNEARSNPAVMGRLDTFLNLYGFCRNIALVFLLAGAALLGRHWTYSTTPTEVWLGLIAIAISGGMTLRYLKFHRIYAVEVFTAYAYGRPAVPK